MQAALKIPKQDGDGPVAHRVPSGVFDSHESNCARGQGLSEYQKDRAREICCEMLLEALRQSAVKSAKEGIDG